MIDDIIKKLKEIQRNLKEVPESEAQEVICIGEAIHFIGDALTMLERNS